ncbi:MAG: lactate utilization protein [Eubacteriales bacterium]|nr:lactate utilization protein [Eubacteriales bacterium]
MYKRQQREMLAKDLVENLNRNNFEAYYAEDSEKAKALVLSLIPKGATIGVGGSATLNETGIMSAIQDGEYQFIDRFNPPEGTTITDALKAGLTADVFLSSTNAVTRDGQLVNVDGTGNRVGAMLYGPGKVIIVLGTNKIVDNIDDAIKRIKNIAAPINAMRLHRNTPCTKTGRCMDCSSPERICNMTTIYSKCRNKGDAVVVVIPEELGF